MAKLPRERAKGPNCIWIELARPPSNMNDPAQREAFYNTQADLATKLLRKMGIPHAKFFYSDRKCCYCYSDNAAGSFLYLSDDGHWFNLDFLSLPDEAAQSGYRYPND